jgi:hypothetical protein
MVKRFSTKAFVLAFVIHFLGTWFLFAASFRALAEWKLTGVADPLWLTLCAWVWQPVSMFALHHLLLGVGRSDYFYFLMLPWTAAVAFCFGFLIPRWMRRTQPII